MAAPAPEFVLSRCTASDVPGMVQVYLSAFASDPFALASFPASIAPSEMHRWLTARFTGLLSKREMHTFKIVHEPSGTLAAFLRWQFPTVLTPEEKADREVEARFREAERKEGRDPAWPTGANLAVCDEKFGHLEEEKKKWVVDEEMYVAHLLATSQQFQRKGLAKMLLQHGLDMADREGRKTYIESTPAGHPIYLKLGFKDVSFVKVDLSKYGGDSIGTNWQMLREPQGQRAV